MWRLDSGARTFLPRLQGALTTISPAPSDPACYIITQADNTIRLVSGLVEMMNIKPLPKGRHFQCR